MHLYVDRLSSRFSTSGYAYQITKLCPSVVPFNRKAEHLQLGTPKFPVFSIDSNKIPALQHMVKLIFKHDPGEGSTRRSG